MKPINSAITTWREAQLSKTGMQAGGRGLQTASNLPAIATWLAARKPEDLDKIAVSRALSHNVELMVKFEGRYPTGPHGERMQSYQVATNCWASGTTENMQKALADLRKFETPADKRTIEGWLAELSVIVAKRQDDNFADSLRAEAYSSRLAQYPADVARYALFTRRWKFWPTWEELAQVCDTKAAPRRYMIAALERGPAKAEPEWKPPTPEEKQRMADLIREKFPHAPWHDEAMDKISKGAS